MNVFRSGLDRKYEAASNPNSLNSGLSAMTAGAVMASSLGVPGSVDKDSRIGSGSVRSPESRLVPKLRRDTVDLHLGVLVIGVRSDSTFNDLAYCCD
jgi:hypothetical protein